MMMIDSTREPFLLEFRVEFSTDSMGPVSALIGYSINSKKSQEGSSTAQ